MLMSEYNYEQDIEVQREEAFEEGQKIGQEIGQEIGQKIGQKRFALLAANLIRDGRADDVIRAGEDEAFCEKLYLEYDV